MLVQSFPACCGAYIITGFPYFYEPNTDQAKEHNKQLMDTTTRFIQQTVRAYDRYAMLIAILIPQQEKGNVEILEAAGFKAVAQGINGVHDSYNTMWVKVREKSATKEVKMKPTPANKVRKSKVKGLE